MAPFLEHPAIFPGLRNRIVATPIESLQASLPAPYFAELGERIWVEVSLPEIAIPLLSGVLDVTIDLQAVFDRGYDTGPYHRRVRSAESTPVPPPCRERAGRAARLLGGIGE